MQAIKWVTLAMVCTLAFGEDENENPEVQNYQYHYFVRDESTGDVKSHEEKKVGEVVSGQYTVGEPTGDLRVVKYTADDGGFRADVKYEEGASPISEKQGRDTSAKSGYEFQWLPANPDEIEASGKENSDENNASENESSDVQTGEGLEQGQDVSTVDMEETPAPEQTSSAELETSSMAQDITISGQDTTGLTQDTTSLVQETSEPTPESGENSAEKKLSDESSEENIGLPANTDQSSPDLLEEEAMPGLPQEMPTLDLDERPAESGEGTPPASGSEEVVNGGNTPPASEEVMVQDEAIGKESEAEKESDEGKEMDTEQPASESEGKLEESAEAAESAPQSAATEPSQSYLPAFPFQNLPFINFPMPMGSPQIESNSPTIIYASQNFYNPWQWLGSRRVLREDTPIEEEANPVNRDSVYLPNLGYLIMPRTQK